MNPPTTKDEGDVVLMLCGVNTSAVDIERTVRQMRQPQIKVVKQPQQSAIIPNRRESALRRIEMIQSEMGRMQKLLDELRADVLHLTVE